MKKSQTPKIHWKKKTQTKLFIILEKMETEVNPLPQKLN